VGKGLRTLAGIAGVLGGLLWLARLALDLARSLEDDASSVLLWSGAALLVAGVLEIGLGLVARAPVWLRAVVAVGVVALAASLVAVLHGGGDGVVVDGALGLVAVVVCARRVRIQRRRARSAAAARRRGGQRRAAGSHAR
jgi:hypothetical protein